MGGVFGNLAYVCSEIWKQIGVAQRLSIALVGLVGLAAMGGVLFFGTRPNWHVLYSELPQETAAKIYGIAKDAKIPVQLADNGRTVKVPYKYANQVRVSVAQSRLDVSQQGVGLELFDELKLGMTEMQQRVGWQRAMQGELERMIARIEGVRSARVILALPEQRVFRRDENRRAEASVFLELDRSRNLGQAKVQSICRMVAGAVPMLRPEDVTVTDSNGNSLARGLGDGIGTGGGLAQHLELRQSMEELLREKAESVLRPIVGGESVVAVVNVEVDDSAVETTTETYDAASAVVISEKMVSEDNTKSDVRRAGAVGAAANLVSVQNPQEGNTANDQSNESRKTVENQYVVPKTVRRVAGRNPRIVRLSVAVTIAQAEKGGPRDPALLSQYRELVASAVGAVTSGADGREDSVTVIEGIFAESVLPELLELSPAEKIMEIVGRVQLGGVARPLLAVFLLFVLYRMFGGMLRRNQFDSMDLLGGDSGLAAHAALPGGGGSAGMLQQVLSVPAAKVRAKAEEAPSEVAANLEAWMTQDSKYE